MTRRTIATATSALEGNRIATFKIEEVKEDTNRKVFDNLLKKMEKEKDKEDFNPEIKKAFNDYFLSFEESFSYELTSSIIGEEGEENKWVETYGSALEAYKEMLEFLKGTRRVLCSVEGLRKNGYDLRSYLEFGLKQENYKGYREEKMKLWEEFPTYVKEAYVKKLLLNNL